MPSGVYPRTEKHKAALRVPKSEEGKANMRKPKSEEHRAKIKKANSNPSKERREKNREAHLGEKNPMFGIHRFGEEAPNFKGGVLADGYHWTCSERLEATVRDRDNQTCQVCGRIWQEGEGKRFDTHHIQGPDDNKEPCNTKKLITLCRGCHIKVNKNFTAYIPQFETIVNQEFVWCGT